MWCLRKIQQWSIALNYTRLNLSLINLQSKNGALTVGDFMTRREDLHVVKPTTTVDEGIVGRSEALHVIHFLFH